MTSVFKFAKIGTFFLILFGMLFLVINYYSIIFSKTVVGSIIAVEKLDVPMALLSRPNTQINPQVFSFAVAIQDSKTKEIFTASAEDRQWAVAQAGKCAEAVFLPYPPWDFEKKGTYFGARLVRLFDCPDKK